MDHPSRIDAHFVVGGASHDFDFVRLEILKLLAEIPEVRTTVCSDFSESARLKDCRFLVTYTCNVDPDPKAESALERFVGGGGRWFVLHATNSLLEWTEAGVASRHSDRPFFDIIGSAFIAHPPIGAYTVKPTETDDPLVAGIEPFVIEDELYLYDMLGPVEVLLETEFHGQAPGFTRVDWTGGPAKHPVMYRRKYGEGEVLFLSPGHARGHYDAPHRTPFYPNIERGAWTEPVYYDLLRRGLRWASGTDTAKARAA